MGLLKKQNRRKKHDWKMVGERKRTKLMWLLRSLRLDPGYRPISVFIDDGTGFRPYDPNPT